jgi:hypothetical protein
MALQLRDLLDNYPNNNNNNKIYIYIYIYIYIFGKGAENGLCLFRVINKHNLI